MKVTLLKQLCKKYLLPDMAGYELKGHLLYEKNFEYLLPGFFFESSAFSKERFTIEVFIQPLYIPAPGYTFTFGSRLGILAKGRDVWWDYRDENEGAIMQDIGSSIHRVGIPFLESRKKLQDFLGQYRKKIDFAGDPNGIEAVAYGYILIGEYQEAEILLDQYNNQLDSYIKKEPEITWQITLQKRVQTILLHLREKTPDAARQQLDEWTRFTLSEVKLIRG